MTNEEKNKRAKNADPMEEKQDLGVTVKLGQIHYEALVRWSKERFGLPNQAGFLRLMIQERWLQEQKEKTAETVTS
jgi:EAL domain-containing protein (putative c-di-GMP-specific phosphodiesterase class I)